MPLLLKSKASPLPPDHPASMIYGQWSVISHLSVQGFSYPISQCYTPQSHSPFKDLLSAHPVPGTELSVRDSEDRMIQPMIRREACPVAEHSPAPYFMSWVIHISSLASPIPTLLLTSSCLFCTYQLCFLFPVPFPPFSPPPLITSHVISISVILFLF